MKKKLVLLLTAMVLVGTFATGCSSANAKKEVETIEEDVKVDASEFTAKVESDLKAIEETAKKDIEEGKKELETIEEEAKASFEKIKDYIEKDAGEAKEEVSKLVTAAEEGIKSLFNK